ncbi:MAG: hypothetical protein RLZ72_634 [Actinomycetota bacterium]
MWRKFRDPRILGVAGLLLSAVVVLILNATIFSAEAFVMRYLTALDDGRGADVANMVWGPADKSHYIVGMPINSDSRPHHPVIIASTASGDNAVVTARVELAGVDTTVDFVVAKQSTWSPISSWAFAMRPVATVTVDSTGNAGASINGVTGTHGGLAYFPSIASVDAPSHWFTTTPQSLVIDSMAVDYQESIQLEPSDALFTTVDKAVHSYLDGCAAQKTLVPKECPFAGFSSEKIAAGPTWEIDSYPTLEISHTGGEWAVTGNGKVRLRVSLVDFATEKTTKYSELLSYVLSGTLADLSTDSPRLVVVNTVER